MKIDIPNPCSEDFEKMTPTEKGAFCEVCSTDTYDFRFMTNDQIIDIMDENQGKHICGRFKRSQIDDINSGFLNWKNQSPRTFQSKFLMACLLAFGLTLFSCETEEEVTIENIRTEQIIQEIEPQIAHINNDLDIENIDLLDYLAEEPLAPQVCEFPDIIDGGVIETAGEIAYERDDYILGGAVVQYIEPKMATMVLIEEDDTTTKEPILAPPIEIDQRIFEATAFPNPTQGLSNVAIDVETEGQFDIMMYDMNGRMIQNIFSGELPSGRQQFEVDMWDLNSGMYIVKVISQGQDETLKIQKLN